MTQTELLQAILQKFDHMEKRFDALEQRLDRVEQRLDALEQRLDRVEQRLDSLEQDMKDLKTKNNAIFEQVAFLTEFRTEVNSKLNIIDKKIDTLEKATKENVYEIMKLKMAVG